MNSILVAGVGNIFMGDDGFGVEVVQRLARRQLPPNVKVVDFGIRGIDLTYALLDGFRAAVLVDAMQRGEEPGTITIVEPEQPSMVDSAAEDLLISPHDLDPAKVLRLVKALGGNCQRLLLVACEPATFGNEEGLMGLSSPVAAAVDHAVAAVETLVRQLLEEGRESTTGERL